MYDKGPRFKELRTTTPARVGPATYFLTDIFDKKTLGNPTPFNSTQTHTSTFENKDSAKFPSPNKYRIRFRKNRIIGGTSMQNRAARFKPKTSLFTRGPYNEKNVCRLPGKVYTGVPPRNTTTKVSSIAENQMIVSAEYYNPETTTQLIQQNVTVISVNSHASPCHPYTSHTPNMVNQKLQVIRKEEPNDHNFDWLNKELIQIDNICSHIRLYFIQGQLKQARCDYRTSQYKGNFWSLRTAKRFCFKESVGPGPAHYAVNQADVSPWQRVQLQLQSKIRSNAPLLRTNDLLLQKVCREGLPGPASYSPADPNSKKCNWGKSGTFGTSQRQNLYEKRDSPGPADYTDPRTIKKKLTSLSQAPFNTDAIRFSVSKNTSIPGPADYTPKNTMRDEVEKRAHSKYAKWNTPFDSSTIRNTSLAKQGSCLIPSPALYFPQLQEKVNSHLQSYMFTSSTYRDSSKINKTSPGPADYSTTEPFKITSTQKSHLQNTKSAFLTSSHRLEPLKLSCSPAPTTYELPSTLSDKGCSISGNQYNQVKDVTPGPSHYTVHSRYANSSVFDTHNITLRPLESKIPKLLKVNMTKVLRSFVANR